MRPRPTARRGFSALVASGLRDEQANAGDHWERTALENLRRIGRKVQTVYQQKTEQHRDGQPARRFPEEQHDTSQMQFIYRLPQNKKQKTKNIQSLIAIPGLDFCAPAYVEIPCMTKPARFPLDYLSRPQGSG